MHVDGRTVRQNINKMKTEFLPVCRRSRVSLRIRKCVPPTFKRKNNSAFALLTTTPCNSLELLLLRILRKITETTEKAFVNTVSKTTLHAVVHAYLHSR